MKRKEILKRSSEIRRFILSEIEKNPKGIALVVAKKFNISRQAATRYLKEMVREKRLTAKGTTKNRSYALGETKNVVKTYAIEKGLEESSIWTKDFKPLCEGLRPDLINICAYGFTEMVNNALDHSGGKKLKAFFERTPTEVFMGVQDDGIGIFRKIKNAFNLSDERQAILELSKGKLTTAPDKHTGEGIFFTSRVFDVFQIRSHDLVFSHMESAEKDVLLHDRKDHEGTTVYMRIKVNSKRKLKDVFNEFADADNNYAFDKTVVPVRLAQYEGEELLSRSQAKRLMMRVENFKTVLLDFEGVQNVGPAFADEIFRVYKKEHPQMELLPINTSEEVMKMIRRAEIK